MKSGLLAFATLVAPSLLFLNGCASTPPPVFSESFITSTNVAGMRLFTYEATFNIDERSARREAGGGRNRGVGGAGGRRGMASAESMPRRLRDNVEQAVMQRIDEIVTSTGYCDKGYFIMRKDVRAGTASAFGECKTG